MLFSAYKLSIVLRSVYKEMDVNEIFENLVLSEEISKEKGFNEGYKIGKNQFLRGYHLGYHKASVLAAQLGYFNGVIEHCLADTLNPQLKEQLKNLRKQIIAFPKSNDEFVDILEQAEDIKFKFTKLCSMAKISSSYPESEKLDF